MSVEGAPACFGFVGGGRERDKLPSGGRGNGVRNVASARIGKESFQDNKKEEGVKGRLDGNEADDGRRISSQQHKN